MIVVKLVNKLMSIIRYSGANIRNICEKRRKIGKNKLFFENHVTCEGDWIALDGLDIDTSAAVIENLKAIRKQRFCS
jgi:hypothetical protein